MKHLRIALAALIAFVSATSLARADIPTISVPFRMTAAGQGPIIGINGQSTCSITIVSGSGFTVVPLASSDGGATTATASSIGGGSITALGLYTGTIASTGLNAFTFSVTSLATGPLAGTVTCGPQVAGGGAGGTVAVSGGSITATIAGNATVVQPSGSNLHMACDSGCGAAPPYGYSTTTTTVAATLKTGAGTFAGVQNLATAAQTAGMTCVWYDNTAASGTVLYAVGPLGASQVVTFAGGQGIHFLTGLTVGCSGGTPVAPGIMTLWI